MSRCRLILLSVLCAALVALPGCVRRTVTIDSQPPGAIVWMNDREVGRTPVEVDFLYYGEYDVRLEKEGLEPQMTSGRVRAPIWDVMPLDFFAELLPLDLLSRTQLTYGIEPLDDDADQLKQRARAFRARSIEPE